MQIFASSSSPFACAIALDDKRLGKMIIESAQILSSVWGSPYKPTHKNHPAMKWVQASWKNYRWLFLHYEFLHQEWLYRFNKPHAAGRWVQFFLRMFIQHGFHDVSSYEVQHVNMTEFKTVEDVHEAYKRALRKKWQEDKRSPVWTRRTKPSWANY